MKTKLKLCKVCKGMTDHHYKQRKGWKCIECELRQCKDEYKPEIEHLQNTEIPRCMKCKKNYVKDLERSGKYHSVWKPDCKCMKKDMRLCIG